MKENYRITSGSIMDAATAARMLSEAFGIRLTEDDLRKHDHRSIAGEVSRQVRLKLKERRLAVMEREI